MLGISLKRVVQPQGVKVMRLDQDAKIVTFTTVQPDEKDEEVVEENE